MVGLFGRKNKTLFERVLDQKEIPIEHVIAVGRLLEK